MQETAGKLRKEDREVGRGRKWRSNYRLLNQEVIVLEEEERQLELVYPQVSCAPNVHIPCCPQIRTSLNFDCVQLCSCLREAKFL